MPKRIALVGNMNNSFFAITRHLRGLGYDAHLFYFPIAERFQPKADTFSLDYTTYTHEVTWMKNGLANVPEEKVREQLNGFDFYIGQGEEAAIAYSCGFNMDVYYPYGSDVYKYAYLPQEYSMKAKLFGRFRKGDRKITSAHIKKGLLSRYIKGAIVDATYLLADYTNEDFEKKLKGLGYKGEYHHVPMPFIYLEEYESVTDWSNADVHWRSVVNKIRKENDFILLYHGRQEWKTYNNEFTLKNTHHVIIGFANYVKKRPEVKATLLMVEYGSDTEHSKELVAELGIEDKVKWLPSMYRKDLMFVIKNVDVCCGEFGRSYLTFGTVIEAMQMKKPVIHYRDDSLYVDKYSSLYPLLNAREPDQIEAAIARAVSDPETTKKIGEEASEWVNTNFIQKPVSFLQSLIEKK